jgi:hypothetical protein
MPAPYYAPTARQTHKIHKIREAEYDIAKAVIAYTALSGGHMEQPSPLWRLAERAGWDLDDFIREVLALGDSVVIAAMDTGVHKTLCGDDCPCEVIWAIRGSK